MCYRMHLGQCYFVSYDYIKRNFKEVYDCIDSRGFSFYPSLLRHGFRPTLRIDNSRHGRIHNLWNISRTTKATTSCNISNERAYFSACGDISGF